MLRIVLDRAPFKRLAAFLLLVSVIGCAPDDPITRVVLDADKSGVKLVSIARMVVGIHRAPQATWTFKVKGPVEDVDGVESACLDFFRQLELSSAEPNLSELPEGWSRAAVSPSPFAPFAKLQLQEGLMMSISRMPVKFDDLDNINRWRGQLSLPPTDTVRLEELKGDPKLPFQIYDVEGMSSGGGMLPPSHGNAAGGGPPKIKVPIEFEAPDGWKAGSPSQMVSAQFTKEDGDAQARIAVSSLIAKLNNWEQVSQNWVSEAGMTSLTAEELKQRTTEITIDSHPGKMIRLVSDEEGSKRALIGMRFEKGDKAWFVKFVGDRKLVVDQEEAFMKFAKSIRFK